MRTVYLQDICEIQIGKTPSRRVPEYWGGELPWVTISDFSGGRKIIETKEKITKVGAGKSGSKLIPAGTLLLTFKLTLGKRAFADFDLYTNEAIAALKVIDDEFVDRDYLYWALGSIDYDRSVDRAAKGKTLNKSKLKLLQIPLPPLEEQKRIAGILDAADALRARRRESLAQLDTLLQSTFLEMFGDPVTNPMGWEVVPFDEVGKFVSGATPSKSRNDFWVGSTPWVSPKDMKMTKIYDAQDHVSESAFEETNLKLLNPGHILIVVRGMILAHSFPVALNCVPVAINQDMKGILPSMQFDIGFLIGSIRQLERKILSEVSTAAHGTKRLDSIGMKEIFVPVPPLELQQRFAAIVESVEQQKVAQGAHLDELDTLFACLQQRAFAGELVT